MMGLLTRLLRPELSANYQPDAEFWYRPIGGPAAAGVDVSPSTSIRVSTVYACVKAIAETVGALPLITYRRKADGGRERADELPLYDVLRHEPNAWQTSFEFWRLMVTCACLYGNAYARIRTGRDGQVDQLVPIHPDQVKKVEQLAVGVRYTVKDPGGLDQVLFGDEIFHISGMSTNGVMGLGISDVARDAIGLAIATETYGAKFFSNGTNVGGFLEVQGKLSPEGHKRLTDDFSRRHAGAGNAHKTVVLEEGMKFTREVMDSDKAQFIESRKFQMEEIARYFRIPAHKIGNLEHSTFSNIEHMAIEFVTDTITPWTVAIEQRIRKQLIPDPRRCFSEFLLEGLLRGDATTRQAFYSSGVNNGWLTRNEVRERENLPKLPGLDEPLSPLNMRQGSDQPKPDGGRKPEASASLLAIARAETARLAKVEVSELAKLARKFPGGPGFHVGVGTFYQEHANRLRSGLQLEEHEVQSYIGTRVSQLSQRGLAGIGDETRVSGELFRLVSERVSAGA